jgi:Tfp pilus assembly protein PilF
LRPTLRGLGRVFLGARPGAAFGEDFRRGRWRWVLLVVLAAVVLGLLAFQGRKAYRAWHRQQLAQRARESLARKDYRGAALLARNALVSDPTNLEASRVIAEAAEQAGSREALWWRSRVAALEPGSASNCFAWAATALRLRDPESAGRALAGVPMSARRTDAFCALAGSLAASVGELGLAEKHLAEASRLNSSNALHRFNLACVQLESTNATTLASGRQAMAALRGQEKFRLSATRALLAEAVRAKDRARAIALVADLRADPTATLADRLVCLDAMQRMRARDAAAYLEELKKGAAGRGAEAAMLISWMNARGMAGEALAWAATLRPEVAAQAPVPLAAAESRESLKDWAGLARVTAGATWEGMEPARLAMLARAERQQGNAAASKTHWQLALAAAQGRVEPLEMLARFSDFWGWPAEREEALWALARAHRSPRWPLQALFRSLRARGDTRGLLKLADLTLERDPGDLAAQNNAAMLRLLLGVETEAASRRAKELLEKAPRSAPLVSTRAFALSREGRGKEAVALMETLPEAELRRPGTAAYYGVLLAEAGAAAKARAYLELAKDSPLLPEEKALVARARRAAGLP